MSGAKDKNSPPSRTGEPARKEGDDTPRETPSAKVSEARVAPGAKPESGLVMRADVASGEEDTERRRVDDSVRLDLPVLPRDATTERESGKMRQSPAIPADDDDDPLAGHTPTDDAHDGDAPAAEAEPVKLLATPQGDTWRPPPRAGSPTLPLVPRDIAFGRVHVRTFEASGVLGAVLVLLGFLVVLGIVVALFTLAVGIGAALAVGGVLAAGFGFGAARVRRALRSASRRNLARPSDDAVRESGDTGTSKGEGDRAGDSDAPGSGGA